MSLAVKKHWLITAALFLAALTVSSASAQTYATNAEQMSGWQSCSVCAGAGGTGATSYHYLQQGITSPALNGTSARAHLGATTAFGNALWWRQLGANNTKTHFVYDLFFYLKQPGYSQALEFDVNQSTGTKKFIFGTQCNIKGGSVWDVYDPAGHAWRHTGIHCGAPSAYQWHHLVWQVYRDSSKVHYVSVSVDGVTHYIGRAYYARSASAREINVAFQMDADRYHHAYDTWLDKINLKYW